MHGQKCTIITPETCMCSFENEHTYVNMCLHTQTHFTKKITLLQVSCIASSPAFRDRELFPRYFQLLPTDASLAIAYLGVIQFYEWKRVAIIVQNENLFTVVCMYACMYVNWSHSKDLSQINACMLKLMRFRHLPLTMYCDV